MQRRLNNTQIENAGVDAVSDYFNFTETLDPSIPKRDTVPALLARSPKGVSKN